MRRLHFTVTQDLTSMINLNAEFITACPVYKLKTCVLHNTSLFYLVL